MTSSARTRIGKYEILQTLGAGGMGTVYLGYDAAIARHVAVKTIRKDVFDERTAHNPIARFRQEAMAAGRLSHPGIVGVYDYGEEEALAYIIMEYAPGEDLEQYLERRANGPQPRPPLPEVATLMAQLLDALGYAHAAGVVHRDIKPSNLFLSGRLKISDFGIARVDRAELTQTGVALGTPAYMAPEQYRGLGTDHRADLFASGVVFYELLTGALPFEGQSIPELAYKCCHVDPIPPTRLRPDLPVEVDAVLSRALAKTQEARFASAAEMAVAVADALSRAGRDGGHPPSPEPASRGFVGAPTWTVSAAMRAMNAVPMATPAEATPPPVASMRTPVDARSGTPPEAPSRAVSVQSAVTPEALDRVAQALAKHVGPIARVMVKKAGVDAASYRDLCLKVSARLGTEEERARFLKEVGVS